MEEARLNYLLRGLPRELASGGFTARVLRRLDEKPRIALAPPALGSRRRRLLRSQRWHRLMVATATVGALGVSVGISVGVLQHERSAMPPSALSTLASLLPNLAPASSPAPLTQTARTTQAPAAAGMAAASMERTFRHESGTGELPAFGLGSRTGSSRPGATTSAITADRAIALASTQATAATRAINTVQAYQLLRELQLERGRLEHELRSLRRPGGGPTVLYLGGDENVDLVLSTGRPRPPGAPMGDRDDGENLNYL
jgi:hypothetical protein